MYARKPTVIPTGGEGTESHTGAEPVMNGRKAGESAVIAAVTSRLRTFRKSSALGINSQPRVRWDRLSSGGFTAARNGGRSLVEVVIPVDLQGFASAIEGGFCRYMLAIRSPAWSVFLTRRV